VNLAVSPGVEVELNEIHGGGPAHRSALVQAALDTYPADVDVVIRSGVPAGSGAGTSAAVAVALIAALTAVRGHPLAATEVARAAHRLETEVLRAESGVQDQLCAAHGGINYIEVDHYPDASVHPLPPWPQLADRLSLIFLGRPHDSPAVHRQVIREARTNRAFDLLRDAATAARDAITRQDLEAFGRAMIANTEAQQGLHPDLIGVDARQLIDLAKQRGALGWKVNGAGGDGGSVTIVASADPSRRAALVAAIDDVARWHRLPLRTSRRGAVAHVSP
jgi:D-glycero-alpha-D-manno-heptose-7-phosphate kinase